MGREGHLLFEADEDINCEERIIDHVRSLIGGKWTLNDDEKISGCGLFLLVGPNGERRVSKRNTRNMKPRKFIPIKLIRKKLDSGVTRELFEKFRTEDFFDFGEYASVILAAHLMTLGGKLDEDDRTYLRDLVNGPKIPSRYGHCMAMCDDGFREPGKVQFLAALEYYKSGEPRELGPSCWTCGKTKAELGHTPAQCNRCLTAHYCGKECQKADWKRHKPICHPPGLGRNV